MKSPESSKENMKERSDKLKREIGDCAPLENRRHVKPREPSYPADREYDLPDPYSSNTDKKMSILLIVDPELADSDFNKLRHVNVKIICSSIDNTNEYIREENLSEYSMVVLHLLSFRTVMKLKERAVDRIKQLISTIRQMSSSYIYTSL
jgi:hypothetical protein